MNAPKLPPEDPSATNEPPDDDVLAAELVLGVLSTEERRAALERAASDASFAALVARWERHFAPWLASIAPVAPPAAVWPTIQRRLGWRESSIPASRWQSLTLWRVLTGLATAAAVVTLLIRAPTQIGPAPPSNPPPVIEPSAARAVTTLTQENGSPGWLASVDRAHGTVLIVPVPRAPDTEGRVPELWIIPAGKAPRSLGLVSIDKSGTVTVPEDSRAALVTGSVLAITLEPPSGAPHTAPSGPIIAKGAIQI
jgi:anti-sigma-K factor RskA